ncbi:hypothetical protein [Adhaeribacter rhizoryzae]|uniref:Uncharacterized protein n=1 Tax=Adhaeribacter rhizoryzae TaxID=2607907 RepID=A0A5M6D185_9BACT|nr:hypothetical protein [Adhaeribacter rhizoryzae]KAA5541261.1 hypothetical protein F0145_20890 [Adhaeribacter rhizoryzae]
MDINYTGLVVTECGRKLKIDLFDQLAVGVIECDNFLKDPSFIPSTFSVYKTASGLYLLQITSFNEQNDTLETTYKIIAEAEVPAYLENCFHNI